MPQEKPRRKSAGLPSKKPSRTAAKRGAIIPVKHKAVKSQPAAKRKAVKRSTELPSSGKASKAAPTKKGKAVNAIAKLPVKGKAASSQTAKTGKAKDGASPVKASGDGIAPKAEQPAGGLAAAGPAIELNLAAAATADVAAGAKQPSIAVCEDRSAGYEGVACKSADQANDPVAAPLSAAVAPGAGTGFEPADLRKESTDRPSIKHAVERRKTIKSLFERRLVDPFAQERRRPDAPAKEPTEPTVAESRVAQPVPPVSVAAAAMPASAKEPEPAEIVGDRRKEVRTLFERRLADPSAKERRASELHGKEVAAQPSKADVPVRERTIDIPAAAKETGATTASPANDIREAARTADLPVARRPLERNPNWGGEPLEATFAASEQKSMLNATILSMRRSGAVLIGLNALVLLAVLIGWRSHSSQQAQIKEMQKNNAASVEQMKRTITAWESAAYASCLRSQTAQSILAQIKLNGAHLAPTMSAAQTGATRAQAAQIELHAETTTGLNAHMPVLFHLGVENVGKSSALNARVWGEVQVLASDKEPRFRYDESVLTKEAIAPTDAETTLVLYTTNAGLIAPLTEDQYRLVNSGLAYVVAYGKVEYEDVYGARHWAVFCHAITEPVGAGTRFRKCQSYNSAGVREAADQPGRTPNEPVNTASMTPPEVACQLSRQQKN